MLYYPIFRKIKYLSCMTATRSHEINLTMRDSPNHKRHLHSHVICTQIILTRTKSHIFYPPTFSRSIKKSELKMSLLNAACKRAQRAYEVIWVSCNQFAWQVNLAYPLALIFLVPLDPLISPSVHTAICGVLHCAIIFHP